ncbi:MAG TPA: hypothetical protein VL527_03585 [Dongiaceae bacterium]|jgi:hypothetical protein|nr:hypothetical protein [Dongiaceae bacterium]
MKVLLLLGVLIFVTGTASRAQTLRISSFTPDGTLTWTSDTSNLFCGIEFKESLADDWAPAPAPFWNIETSSQTNSARVPASVMAGASLFLRVVGSASRLRGGETYDVDLNGLPRFAASNYIELSKIQSISRFRSGLGHDYSDDFESCRSMKHYFVPRSGVDRSGIQIFSPVGGTVFRMEPEQTANSGVQVWLKSSEYPAFYFVLFHMNPLAGLSPGAAVTAGQNLGTHINSDVVLYSDIAVRVDTPTGLKLVSYFEVMTDTLFSAYQSRGVSTRSALIITREARDADSLTCNGEEFLNGGSIANLVDLN